ncbi:transcription factor MYC2-like protein [Tanacetum coccineum]
MAQSSLQTRLKFILQNRPERWLYAIFWQASKDTNEPLVLKWADGYFPEANYVFGIDDVSDTQWLIMSSLGMCFPAGHDVVGQCFGLQNQVSEGQEEVMSTKKRKMSSSDSDPLEDNSSSSLTTKNTCAPKRKGRRVKGTIAQPEVLAPGYHVEGATTKREAKPSLLCSEERCSICFKDGQGFSTSMQNTGHSTANQVEVEVKLLESEAMIRVQSAEVNHPACKLMDALRSLNLKVHYASVSCVKDLMLQDVIVKVPNGFTSDEDTLRLAVLNKICLD